MDETPKKEGKPPAKTIKFNVFDKLPEPKKIISLILVVAFGTYLFHYWGAVVMWMLEYYMMPKDVIISYLQVSAGLALVFFVLLVLIYSRTGEVTMPFLIASFLNKPIIPMLTKNRQCRFVVPKEVHFDTWTINDESAIEPNPDGIIIGPNKIPIMFAIPECGKGLDIRGMLAGRTFNLDVTAYKQYAKFHEQKAWAKAQNFVSNFTPYIIPLIILITVLAVVYPTFEKRMTQDGAVADMSNRLTECHLQLADHGIRANEKVAPTTTQPDPTVVREAKPPMEVK
jgi:hypothetical protein